MDDYLLTTKQMSGATPYTYYWGEMSLQAQ